MIISRDCLHERVNQLNWFKKDEARIISSLNFIIFWRLFCQDKCFSEGLWSLPEITSNLGFRKVSRLFQPSSHWNPLENANIQQTTQTVRHPHCPRRNSVHLKVLFRMMGHVDLTRWTGYLSTACALCAKGWDPSNCPTANMILSAQQKSDDTEKHFDSARIRHPVTLDQ